jgi:hypothetical protein
MDAAALIIEVFGVGSLAAALIKCTLAKRKFERVKINMKNNSPNRSRNYLSLLKLN